MIYGINDTPKTIKEWFLYAIQQLMAVFVATVLIANICQVNGHGMDISATLFGACIGTIIYQFITKFKSPMFISSCGATVSAVCGALALNSTGNYLMVAIGGLTIAIIYSVISLVISKFGFNVINKILPSEIVGTITIVIGANLAKFLVTYCGQYGLWDTNTDFATQCTTLMTKNNIAYIIIALITMLSTAIVSHYGRGFVKNIPFLIGLGIGYICAIIATYAFNITVWSNQFNEMRPLVDFTMFKGIKIIALPDFAFLHINADQWSINNFIQTLLYFVPVSLAAICEHWADHRTLSNIIGVDLTENPGMNRTLVGDGLASFAGTLICGLPNTSYGESIATIGFSKVASTLVTTTAACMLGLMSFIPAIATLINTIPACVFGGCAMILYGYIAASGLKILASNVDLTNNKSLILVSVVLTIGISGIAFLVPAFSAVSLALIVGVVLNLILHTKKTDHN